VGFIEDFLYLRVELVKLQILMLTVYFIFTVLIAFVINFLKISVPFIFYRIDPEFLEKIFVFEKKDLRKVEWIFYAILIISVSILGILLGALINLHKIMGGS